MVMKNIDNAFDKPVYSISSAARLLDISVHTLRMYEREGLIIPFKEGNKNRLYSDRDIERLKCIRNKIKKKKFSISAIQAMLSLLPCWAVINCPIEKRDKCPAFINAEKPCWTYFKNEGCLNINCRDCKVYQNFKCEKIKETIKNYTS